MKTGDVNRVGSWFQTYSSIEFYIMDPREDEILIEDIAHALAYSCRYNGHCKYFHSVAMHSVLVSQVCKPENALWGLLHDASEAYTGDMVKPLKRHMEEFKRIEDQLMKTICHKFGLPEEMPEDVDAADLSLLALERQYLMGEPPRPWNVLERVEPADIKLVLLPPEDAEYIFLSRFQELTGA